MIPKLIHQIYWNFSNPNGQMPKDWKNNSEECKKVYYDSEYILWSKSMGEKLISQKFSWLLPRWKLASDIEKVDILRYVVLYEKGGMYLDLDTHCLKKYEIPENIDIILGGTGKVDSLFFRVFYSINNNILFSKPKHPFWFSLLQKISKTKIFSIIPTFVRISMSTGPYMLQKHYENYLFKRKIKVIESLSIACPKSLSNIYFLHKSAKSWINIKDVLYLAFFVSLILCIPMFFIGNINKIAYKFFYLFSLITCFFLKFFHYA